MKRKHLLTLLLASFFIIISLHGVDAQTSISGDDVCGKTSECKISDLKIVYTGIFRMIITLGLPLMVVFIIYRFVMAWYALQQGNANAYKEATQKVTQGLIGFIIVVALFGGIFLAMLRYLGVKEPFLKLLNSVSSVSIQIIPHAYAATASCNKPKIGQSCTFFAPGEENLRKNIRLSGVISTIPSTGAFYCKDQFTGIVNQTEYSMIKNCSDRSDGTLCDLNDYYHDFGLCSGGDGSNTKIAFCAKPIEGEICNFTRNINGGEPVVVTGKIGGGSFNGFYCEDQFVGRNKVSEYTDNTNDTNTYCNDKKNGTLCGLPRTGLGRDIGVCSGGTYIKPAVVSTPTPTPAPVTPAAPQAPTQLPNPLGFTSLYDFILGALSLVMKFFIYPALVAIWVWSGFSFVLAQGAPDKLNKAKNLLLWAFVSTLIVFMTNMFLLALKGSVEKIVPPTTTTAG